MSSIEAIGAVDQVLKLARTPNESAATATQALSEKFEALMKPGPGTEQKPESLPIGNGVNSVTDVMSKKEAMLNELFADTQVDRDNASAMSMNELMLANMDLSRRMAIANVGMQSVTALGQNTNKSLQSLLKNQ
jgi:hypothetical protein